MGNNQRNDRHVNDIYKTEFQTFRVHADREQHLFGEDISTVGNIYIDVL